MNNVWNTK